MADETNGTEEVQSKPKRKITALSDFRSLEFDAEITLADEIIEIPCKMLTYARYQQIGRMVATPAAPLNGADRNGRPIRNYDDPTWLAQRADAEDKRTFLRIAEMVQLPIDGKTLEEKAEKLQEILEPAIVIGLARVLNGQFNESEDAIANRAATFHSNGHAKA